MHHTDIAETFRNSEGNVIKSIFYNGAEICLKTISGCTNDGSPRDKEKAVLFIPSSIGCRQGCEFCYLTAKKYPFVRLKPDDIINMGMNFITQEKDLLKDRYLKISFMGMGDILDGPYNKIKYISINLLGYATQYGIKGIDGIDIGTSFPKRKKKVYADFLNELHSVNKNMITQSHMYNESFNQNNQYVDTTKDKSVHARTRVRLFVSLNGGNDIVRGTLMPNSLALDNIKDALKNIDIDLIFHTMFIRGINDNPNQVYNILKFIRSFKVIPELRLLRFNKCPQMEIYESTNIENIIQFFMEANIPYKYQISPGSEISAACGQFLCKKYGEQNEPLSWI